MGERRVWPALVLRQDAGRAGLGTVREPGQSVDVEDRVAVLLDDFSPIAIEDLAALPLPPVGLWDPTHPPLQQPSPSPLAWRVFFSSETDRDAAAAAVRIAHPTWRLTPEDIADDDWARRSQRAITAITAGAFVVAPPWDIPSRIAPANTLIVIEPARGFGTGHHASTRLCLRALSGTDVRGRRVLDLGTGSGVLAIAAALAGAARVVAVDVDADAIQCARESAALNPHAGPIEWVTADFRHGDDDRLAVGAWDVILANLTGGMLRVSAARLRELVAPAGVLIASGFDRDEHPLVVEALQLVEDTVLSEDEWVGIVAHRP